MRDDSAQALLAAIYSMGIPSIPPSMAKCTLLLPQIPLRCHASGSHLMPPILMTPPR